MQERLLRVPLYMYLFAISLMVVAMTNLNGFTLTLAGMVTLMCVLRICERPTNSGSGFSEVEESPHTTQLTVLAPGPNTKPQPDTVQVPAIKTTDQETNGHGLRIPRNGGAFVFEVPDSSTSRPSAPTQEHTAAIARFFQRGAKTAVAEEALVPKPLREPGELEILYGSTRVSYLAKHPQATDVLGNPAHANTPVSMDELDRLNSLFKDSELAFSQADAEYQLLLAEMGFKPAPNKAKADFIGYTSQMLMWLDADEQSLEQELSDISTRRERDTHAVDLATAEVMQRDPYDYMPSPFPTLPRVRGCPTLPRQQRPQQMSAGYRATGHTPSP